MVEEMSARLTSALALSDAASVNLGLLGGEALNDPFFYLVGRLLARKKVVAQSFMAAISGVWGLRDRLSIREESNGLFVFQFKIKVERDRVLHGGPWHYNHSMLLLADYDGIGEVSAVPLHSMEVWVAVKGLGIALRNEKALNLIGSRSRRNFQFSPLVSVDVELKFEKCFGICVTCGFFLHGPEGCDKALLQLDGSPSSLSIEGVLGLSSTSGSLQMASKGGSVVSLGVNTKAGSGKDVALGNNAPKLRSPGLGAPNPFFSTANLGSLNPSQGFGGAVKPLFSVKGFSAQAFAAIPKLGQQQEEGVTMESMASLSHLSGSRRSAAVLLIQPGKKAKMVEDLDSSKGLELAVVPHLTLADPNGRIIISPAKKKKGRPLGAKNKVKGANSLATAIADRPKFKGRKLKIDAVVEGSAHSLA